MISIVGIGRIRWVGYRRRLLVCPFLEHPILAVLKTDIIIYCSDDQQQEQNRPNENVSTQIWFLVIVVAAAYIIILNVFYSIIVGIDV